MKEACTFSPQDLKSPFVWQILDSIEAGISILDPQMRIIAANAWTRRLYSHHQPLEGKLCYRVCQERDQVCPWCPVVRALETETMQRDEVPYIREGETQGHLEITAYPLLDESGRMEGVIQHLQDISSKVQARQELEAEKEKFHLFADYTANWEYWISPQREIIYTSPACQEFTGYTPREFIREPDLLFRIVHPEDKALLQNHEERFLPESHQYCELQFRIINRNGELRWINHRCRPVFDSRNNYQGRRVSHSDITQRKNADGKLLERIKELNCLFEAAWIINQNYPIETGLESLVRVLPSGFYYQDLAWAKIEYRGQSYTTDNYQETPWTISRQGQVAPDEEVRITLGYAWEMPEQDLFLLEEAKLLDSITGFITNYLIRKEMESALLTSQEQLNSILEQIPAQICRLHPDLTIEFINRACCEFFGISDQELVGTSFLDLVPLERRDLVRRHYSSLRRDNPATSYEQRVQGPDQRFYWQNWMDKAIFDSQGRILAYQSVGVDITQQKENELKEKEILEQLQHASKLAALGTLVSGVGHEINNPNSFIMLNAPMIQKAWQDALPILEEHAARQGDFHLAGIPFSDMSRHLPGLLKGIIEGSQRIKNIVADLKDFTRQNSQYTFQRVDLNQLLAKALRLMQHKISKYTDNFQVIYGEDLPVISGDSQKLEQVVMNLLLNACQALNHRNEAVTLRTRCDPQGEAVLLEVEDEGRGIDPRDQERLLDPFYTTRHREGGTGLGLSITSSIVQEHGGRLEYFSQPDQGTIFRVYLPAAGMSKYMQTHKYQAESKEQ
ncbi:PAS domain-containing protein [Desulfonatronospira sp.]|uniref:PAS domain-containing sensor histidine kinase n=1 Tax=Desulfonatronospira sp. TaxID=1962951 RepID=UPI0025BD7C89|nr:PAS domain-containing protein [Desulfonatronospira sp.]